MEENVRHHGTYILKHIYFHWHDAKLAISGPALGGHLVLEDEFAGNLLAILMTDGRADKAESSTAEFLMQSIATSEYRVKLMPR